MQTFMLELLSNDGRGLVMSVMAQRNTLYPPGAEPLKCIVTNYSSLTGSDKWVLASFMLFVFKPVLQDVESMVRDVVWSGVGANIPAGISCSVVRVHFDMLG